MLLTPPALFILAKAGHLDQPIKKIVEFYLTTKNIKATIRDLRIKRDHLLVSEISFKAINNTVQIKDLKVMFSFKGKIIKPLLTATVESASLIITSENNLPLLSGNIEGYYSLSLPNLASNGTLTLNSITSQVLSDFTKDLSLTPIFCSYKNDLLTEAITNCHAKLIGNTNISLTTNIYNNKITLNSELTNVPINIYQIAEKIVPASKIFLFLRDLKSGQINYGKLEAQLDEKFFQEGIITAKNLSGEFDITNLEYQYNQDFPALKNTELKLLLLGTTIKALLNKGYIAKTLISNGVVTLDWHDLGTSNVAVNALSKGPVVDFTNFILVEDLKNLQKRGINLTKITGVANSKIEMSIPLNPNVKNSYNISSELSNVALKIFNDNISLTDAKIQGLLNRDYIILSGEGQINNCPSKLDYQFNLTKQENYKQLLKIKTHLKGQNQKIGLLKLLSGNANLDFEYKNTNNQDDIIATANLQNLEFYLDKIPIHKLIGEKANFTLRGSFNPDLNGNLNMELIGDNKLKIIGKHIIVKDQYRLLLPIINHRDTELKGEITSNQNNFSANIHGSKIDLSEANMLQFLEKGKDNTTTNLKVDIATVKLKNNIMLNDLKLQIKCDKVKCFEGYLDSKIGSKSLKMSLTPLKDQEKWLVSSDNAGAVLKGIGIYTNMKAGDMTLSLETQRQQVPKGQLVPIINGDFVFKHFFVDIKDTQFLTKVISFISLPGFVHFVTNNQYIGFSNMKGKFNYNNNIIKISDAAAEGPFFDFTMQGTINTNEHNINLQGRVVPSLYGISALLKNLPIVGNILSGGHRKGIVSAPYSIDQKY